MCNEVYEFVVCCVDVSFVMFEDYWIFWDVGLRGYLFEGGL